MKTFLLSLALLISFGAQAADDVLRFHGFAYDLETGQHLYTEVHKQNVNDGRWASGSIRYYDPLGKEIGFKTLDFSQDPYVPVYRTTLSYVDYYEGISAVTADGIVMVKKERGKKEKTATLKRRPPQAGDSGIHSIIRDNLPILLSGKTATFRLALAGALDDFRFKVSKLRDVSYEGIPAVELVMKPDSLLSIIADDVFLVYEPIRGRLLEYRGPSNLHDPKTGDPWLARIIYPAQTPADVRVLPPLD